MSRVHFIYGPPGCGKTTELSRLARRAAEAKGPNDVVIASLTRAAAAEIGGRDTGIPDENVGTLHAHCYRALDRPKLAETAEGIKSWNEAYPANAITGTSTVLEDATISTGGDSEGAGNTVHEQVQLHRARMTPTSEWTADQQAHHAAWADWKTQTGRQDFTDLIEACIHEGGWHPAAPGALLLDEVQDFSRLELTLAAQWGRGTGRNGTTVMVGDPDQAIYGFRGADPTALNELAFDDTRALSQSYRVPAAVHHAARTWIRNITDRVDVPYEPTSTLGQTGHAGLPLRDTGRLLDTIHTELAADPGRTVMVLVTCGYMLQPLITRLRADGIPFHNPYRTSDGRWNPMRGTNRLRQFLRANPRVWGDQARCWTWDDLRQWAEPLSAKTAFERGAKTWIDRKCERDRFGESQRDDEVPLEQLFELLGTTTTKHPALTGDTKWWYANLRAAEKKKADYAMRVLEQGGHQVLGETPRLILGTIHSVKGGEADTVIVAPDLSNVGYWTGWHAGGDGRDQIRRMFYVALTRARDKCIVLNPSGREYVTGLLTDNIREAIAA